MTAWYYSVVACTSVLAMIRELMHSKLSELMLLPQNILILKDVIIDQIGDFFKKLIIFQVNPQHGGGGGTRIQMWQTERVQLMIYLKLAGEKPGRVQNQIRSKKSK